jgi:putative membrane protein
MEPMTATGAATLAAAWAAPRPGVLLFGLLVPLAIVCLVAYAVWELTRSREAAAPDGPAPFVPGAPPSAPALAVLDERFARGEIDAEEYVHRRNLMVYGSPQPSAPPAPPAEATSEQPPVDPDEPGVSG